MSSYWARIRLPEGPLRERVMALATGQYLAVYSVNSSHVEVRSGTPNVCVNWFCKQPAKGRSSPLSRQSRWHAAEPSGQHWIPQTFPLLALNRCVVTWATLTSGSYHPTPYQHGKADQVDRASLAPDQDAKRTGWTASSPVTAS